MAQSVTTAAVGRVNRRFLLLAIVLSILSAVLVYAAVSRSDKGGTSTGSVPVVVAQRAIPAGTTLTADMLELRDVSSSDVGDQPVSTIDEAVGKVVRYPLAANEQVLFSKVVGGTLTVSNDVLSNIIQSGSRAMAISTSAVTGAGGLVLPGDHVDLMWVPTQVLNDTPGAMVIAENIEVLAVKQTLEDIAPSAPGVEDPNATPAPQVQRVRGSEAAPIPDASTLTLMLTPEQASLLFCAEHSGEVRLALRAFGDDTPSGLAPATCVLLAPR